MKTRAIAFSYDNACNGSRTISAVGVHQHVAIDKLQEVAYDKNFPEHRRCTPRAGAF